MFFSPEQEAEFWQIMKGPDLEILHNIPWRTMESFKIYTISISTIDCSLRRHRTSTTQIYQMHSRETYERTYERDVLFISLLHEYVYSENSVTQVEAKPAKYFFIYGAGFNLFTRQWWRRKMHGRGPWPSF